MDFSKGLKVDLNNAIGAMFMEALEVTGDEPGKALGNMIREYHRRVFNEKNDEKAESRSKGMITHQMAVVAYDFGKRYFEGNIGLVDGAHEVERITGMNAASAQAYMHDFVAMRNGKQFARLMSIGDTKYFIERMFEDYGEDGMVLAVKAVAKHIAYYQGVSGQAQMSKRKMLMDVLKEHGLSEEYGKVPVVDDFIDADRGVNEGKLKVGKVANVHLRRLLETELISKEMLLRLQDMEYSKANFDLQYPLLVRDGSEFESIRYYKKPLEIRGGKYYMCSQWFEVPGNDERSYLVYWMGEKFGWKE